MKYSNELWAKCRWRIDNVPKDKKVYEEYPELFEIFSPIIEAYAKADDIGISLDLLIRYVVAVYHRYSPYAIQEQNIVKRKIDVCDLIGLPTNKSETVNIIANQNRLANNAAMHFLKQENMEWAELQQYLNAYFQIMGALTDDTVQDTTKTVQDIAKVKLGIVKEMKGIKQEIEQLSSKVFAGDIDLVNYVEQYKKAEEANFQIIMPEDFIRSKRVAE
jgi:hypothetical protein